MIFFFPPQKNYSQKLIRAEHSSKKNGKVLEQKQLGSSLKTK